MRLQEQGRCVPGYGRQPTGCKADHWAERNSVRDNRQYRMHTGQNTERQPENNKLARTHAKVVCHAANGALDGALSARLHPPPASPHGAASPGGCPPQWLSSPPAAQPLRNALQARTCTTIPQLLSGAQHQSSGVSTSCPECPPGSASTWWFCRHAFTACFPCCGLSSTASAIYIVHALKQDV